MTYKNILVQIKTNEDWSPHIDYAFGIAAHFRARIVGLSIFDDIAVLRRYAKREGQFGHERMAQRAIEQQTAHDARITAALTRRFTAAAQERNLPHEFVAAEARSVDVLPWAGRFHDLTILEQPDPNKDEGGHGAAEETALFSGRPLIIVPQASQLVPVPQVLLLAWNSSREAAAACQGVLPFLPSVRKITVLVGARKEVSWLQSAVPQFEIGDYLRQHVKEVSVEEAIDSNDAIGDYILERADAVGAELIVMGAYGRSRVSELILGGATRQVLRDARRPVLMNH